MTRPGFFLLLCLVAAGILVSFGLAANQGPDGNPTIDNTLLVQQACVVARDHLTRGDPKQAVDLLEANLARINGDRKYLNLLRDAYRAYVKDLTMARQTVQLNIYKKRLQILEDFEPAANNAPMTAMAVPGKADPRLSVIQPAAKPAAQMVVRAAAPDPFDSVNEIKSPLKADLPSPGKQVLARAEDEFKQKRYGTAKLLYEQAFQADSRLASSEARGCWAYCQLSGVVDYLNSPTNPNGDWVRLEAQVKQAVEILPNLANTGNAVLGEIQKRKTQTAATVSVMASTAPVVKVLHQPKTLNGWQVAETSYFRVLHNQAPEFAEKVARVAEETRLQMTRKWFGKDDDEWTSKCDIFLHASARDYNEHTKQNAAGHSRIDLDERTGRVSLRQIHLRCDSLTLFDSVLPHEATHAVLAGRFGDYKHVPRWVDEGIAVLTEPADKVQQHRKNLARSLQNRDLIPIKDLVALDQYPTANPQVSTFYAQSVALVEFLTKQKGPVAFTHFVRESLRDGFEPALQRTYGFATIADLQTRFTDRIIAEAAGAGATYAER